MPAPSFGPAERRAVIPAWGLALFRVARCCGLAAAALIIQVQAAPSERTQSAPASAQGDAAARPSGSLRIAAAANFRIPLTELAGEFERRKGVGVALTFGSSGLLAAQIRQGAPFDAFFSADTERPGALVGEGLAIGPVTVYAQGRVALRMSPGLPVRTTGSAPDFGAGRIGIPNPELAPYGAAAVQCLKRLGVWEQLRDRLVFGNNVNQIDHFLESGALHSGFVALSQLAGREIPPRFYWTCPADFHAPIDQGAVILSRARHPATARALLQFMTQPATRTRLLRMGYAGDD